MAAELDVDVETTEPGVPRSPMAVLRQLRGDASRRLGWGLADQVMSSLTNFAVSIYVVHALGAVQFGAFSLAYVTYGLALNASRGLATDPLMVRFSGTDLPTWRRAVTDCTGTAAVVGLATGACIVVAASVLSGPAEAAFLALGLTMPGLLLQDSWRFSFFALGRGSQAFINDAIWVLTLFPALALLRATHHADVFWVVFAWGATAAIGAAVGPWQARVIPRLAGAWRWVSQHRDLGPRYLAEGTAQSIAVQLRAYSVSIALGLAALGSVQAAATLFGPINILFFGIALVAIPEAARVLRRSPRHLPLFCALLTGGLSAAGLVWGIVLLIAVPRGLGHWLLGPIWRSTYPLVLPSMFFVVGQGMGSGSSTGLHALGASRRSLRLTLFMAVLYVTFSMVGAFSTGTAGAVWGAAVAMWIAAVYGWWQLHAAQKEMGHLPAGHRFWLTRPNWRRRSRQALTAPRPDPITPDPITPGEALWRDPASEAAASSAATPAPPLPLSTGTPSTGWLPMPARRRRGVRVPGAAGRLLLAGGVVLAVIAAGWVLAHGPARTHHPAGAPATAAGAQAGAGRTPAAQPRDRARPLKPRSAASFDPYGDGLGENSQLAPLAIDGNPATAWHTQWYASPSFGDLKPGTGLLLDMGQTVTISTVRVLLGTTPGAGFQVRVGTDASSLAALRPVAHAADAGGQVSLHLTSPAHGRYILIWFTQLPPDGSTGTYQADVYNISLEG